MAEVPIKKSKKEELTEKSILYELYQYHPLEHKEEEITEALKAYHKPEKTIIQPQTFVGIEVEVEGIKSLPTISKLVNPVWAPVSDGSLRNQGIEFVSRPIRGDNVYAALVLLHDALYKNTKPIFSERTSVHVHVNVRRMTMEQVLTMLLVYLVTEKTLFSFLAAHGHDRERNIFCVPITESKYFLQLAEIFAQYDKKDYGRMLHHMTELWRKYTAFNTLPLNSKGTMEFRHMGGTMDVNLLFQWINLILSLKAYSHRHSLDAFLNTVMQLNTNSEYLAFLQNVFGQHFNVLMHPNIERELEDGVLVVKDAISWAKSSVGDEEVKDLDLFQNSSLFKFLEVSYNAKLTKYDPSEFELKLKELKKQYAEWQVTYSGMSAGPEKKEIYKTLVRLGREMEELQFKIEAKREELNF